MSEQKVSLCLGYHAVCLIDVLGQNQRLAQWVKLPEDEQTKSEFYDAVRGTIGTILSFRNQFISVFEQWNHSEIDDTLAALPKETQEIYRRFKPGFPG